MNITRNETLWSCVCNSHPEERTVYSFSEEIYINRNFITTFRKFGHCLLFPSFRKMICYRKRTAIFVWKFPRLRFQEEIPPIVTPVCDFYSQTFHLASFIYCILLRARLGVSTDTQNCKH
jgi:hypothetical protein